MPSPPPPRYGWWGLTIWLAACALLPVSSLATEEAMPLYQDASAAIPDRVDDLLSRMTLDEKIGQMTLVDWPRLESQSDVGEYYLGALFASGGQAPELNIPAAWADMYDAHQSEALSTRLGIPILFGVDAVHGHNTLYGATVFPHNIGLGATRNPELVEEVGRITAREVVASGLNWTFSPCLCVARNERWGRTYESFGEDPEIASTMTSIVNGYQGTDLGTPNSILATAKHWVGDGGTNDGVDTGDTRITEAELRDIHMQPYMEAIEQGVASVMVSYSSWNGERLHGHHYLITQALKGELGFNGFVVSDMGGIEDLSDDYSEAVRTAVNAGIDIVMIPDDRYPLFIDALRESVLAGDVSLDRIDDAVRRILTKKFELGLFELPYADRSDAGLIGSEQHRAIAREAVQQSLVLLQNRGDTLPLPDDLDSVFVAGKNADDIGNQSGGWTMTWQGASGDIMPGTTILEGIKQTVSSGTRVTYERGGRGAEGHDIAIVIIGETPYAESDGDRPTYLGLDDEDLATLAAVNESGVPMIVVLVSGRPLIVTEQLPSWDAFVAAWLPGTEGQGVADVLFGDADFSGRLPFTWPRTEEQVPMNTGDADYDPLFPYGFGLTYGH